MTDYFQTDLSFLNIPAEVVPVRKVSIANAKGAYKYPKGFYGVMSNEQRRKISKANKGRKRSLACRKAMSIRNKGKVLSPEHRAKIKASLLKAYKTGRKQRMTKRGLKILRKVHLGAKRRPETCARIAAAAKARWQDPKWRSNYLKKRKAYYDARRKQHKR